MATKGAEQGGLVGVDDGRSTPWALTAEWQQGGIDGSVVVGRLGFSEFEEETVGEQRCSFLEATPETQAAVPGFLLGRPGSAFGLEARGAARSPAVS